MQNSDSTSKQALALAKKQGVLRPCDLEAHGIARHFVTVLYRAGQLQRVGRGLYALPDAPVTENHDFALLAARIPKAIVCLLSALRFHEITSQLPSALWIGLEPKARRPSYSGMPVEVVRFSGAALTDGIAPHVIDGVTVHITTPARTVVDCFRLRHRVGRDVAVEALRDAMSQGKATVPEIIHHAVLRHATSVMQPYVEMYL